MHDKLKRLRSMSFGDNGEALRNSFDTKSSATPLFPCFDGFVAG